MAFVAKCCFALRVMSLLSVLHCSSITALLCVVLYDGFVASNLEVWETFYERVREGLLLVVQTESVRAPLCHPVSRNRCCSSCLLLYCLLVEGFSVQWHCMLLDLSIIFPRNHVSERVAKYGLNGGQFTSAIRCEFCFEIVFKKIAARYFRHCYLLDGFAPRTIFQIVFHLDQRKHPSLRTIRRKSRVNVHTHLLGTTIEVLTYAVTTVTIRKILRIVWYITKEIAKRIFE